MDRQLELVLSLPLKVIVASYTLNLAADTAVKVVDTQWVLKAHRLCSVIGMDGVIAFLGSFGLFLAFLICAFGMTAGFLVTSPANGLVREPRAFSGTVFTGFSVFAGCSVAGTFVFFLFVMLVTLELKGLLLIGFLLAAVLLLEFKHQHYGSRRVSSGRMLILFSVTFITMLLAVQCTYVMNLFLIFLVPFLVLLRFTVDKIAFKKPRGYIILSFIMAVVFTGLALGLSIDEYYLKNPLLIETASALNSVVYKMVLLTGLVGAFAGALVAHFWIEQEANGLSLWICSPVAVILFNLDVDSPVSLHGFLKSVLGPGGELGLLTSFAAASGFSFGLALEYAHIMLPLKTMFAMLVILGLLFHFLISSINLFMMATIELCLGLLTARDDHHKLVPLHEAAWDFAILAKVMMGAAILGLAGLLTGALGDSALSAVLLVFCVVAWKAGSVSCEEERNTV